MYPPRLRVITPLLPAEILMPLFKNLFVFVSPVPPFPVGTALSTSPSAVSPALALALPSSITATHSFAATSSFPALVALYNLLPSSVSNHKSPAAIEVGALVCLKIVGTPTPALVIVPPPAPDKAPAALKVIPEFFRPALALANFNTGVPSSPSNPALTLNNSAGLNILLPSYIPPVILLLESIAPLALIAPSSRTDTHSPDVTWSAPTDSALYILLPSSVSNHISPTAREVGTLVCLNIVICLSSTTLPNPTSVLPCTCKTGVCQTKLNPKLGYEPLSVATPFEENNFFPSLGLVGILVDQPLGRAPLYAVALGALPADVIYLNIKSVVGVPPEYIVGVVQVKLPDTPPPEVASVAIVLLIAAICPTFTAGFVCDHPVGILATVSVPKL